MQVEINGINIFYKLINNSKENEQKPFIVFMHEGLGSVAQWFGFDDLLCKEINLAGLSYDRYGYGKSSQLREKRMPDYIFKEADFLNLLLLKLNIKIPVILFGHSDGATISLIYAATYPKNIIAVISEAHHIIIEQKTIEGMKKAAKAYENGKLKNALAKYHPQKVDSMFYAWADFSLYPNATDFSLVSELKKIQAPVLAIQGENDQYGTDKQLKLVEKYCPNSITKLIEDCGHIAHRERTEIVIGEIKNFLKKKTRIF